MLEEILKHYHSAMSYVTSEDHLEKMLKARNVYFERTGKPLEEDDNFESRMSMFNDWYLFNYIDINDPAPISSYVKDKEVPEELSEILCHVNFSLFEYTGQNFKKQHVMKDYLHDKKVTLMKDHPSLPLIKNDLFVGRIASTKDGGLVFNGICSLPTELKSILVKRCKAIRKGKVAESENDFLLKIEYNLTKWKRYGHVQIEKIFQFS